MNKHHEKIAEIIKRNTTIANIDRIVKVVLIRKMLVKDLADLYEEEAKQPADDGGLRDKFNKTLFLKKAGVQK